MDLKEFLSSGLLESHALGQCTPAEAKMVAAQLARHPEARRELDSIENALEKYATAVAVAPPAWMRGRILEQIGQAGGAAGSPPSAGKYLIAKPLGWVLLFVGALMFARNWQLNFENRDKRQQLEQQNQRLRDCDTREQARLNLQKQIAALTAPDTKTIEVKWLDQAAHPEARALVYTNSRTQETFLGLAELPALAAEQDYQLWVVVEGNPAPVPMEVFAPQADGGNLRSMTFHAGAQAFAVSVEPKGGSPNGKPTTVVMLGKPS